LEGRILAVSRSGKSSSTHGKSFGIPGSPPRTSFAKIREPLEVPNLLALQTESFDWLVGNEAWRARVSGQPDSHSGLAEILGELSRPDSATRARQASLPTSQSKDSVCSARRFGTSSGSRILAKEVRGGAPGIPDLLPYADRDLPERETAKMRPSKDSEGPTARLPYAPGSTGHHEVGP
jgi:hypothetical protein